MAANSPGSESHQGRNPTTIWRYVRAKSEYQHYIYYLSLQEDGIPVLRKPLFDKSMVDFFSD